MIDDVGQCCAASSTRSSWPVGSPHTTAIPSSSRSNTPGAQNEQLPDPTQVSRLIRISSATVTRGRTPAGGARPGGCRASSGCRRRRRCGSRGCAGGTRRARRGARGGRGARRGRGGGSPPNARCRFGSRPKSTSGAPNTSSSSLAEPSTSCTLSPALSCTPPISTSCAIDRGTTITGREPAEHLFDRGGDAVGMLDDLAAVVGVRRRGTRSCSRASR